jgi:hypothetical protein
MQSWALADVKETLKLHQNQRISSTAVELWLVEKNVIHGVSQLIRKTKF